MAGIPNDVDIEMMELGELADETAAETCRACGEVGQSITFYESARGAKPHVEAYECLCGHRSVWINRRRQS